MSFKDGNWAQRFTKMGDEAEGHFEQYATDVLKLGFVRYGLNRPPINMGSIPKRLAYTPDYMMSNGLVEVQGVGRDQKCKFKHDKLNSLRWWNDFQRATFGGVSIYIWDSHKKRECMFPMSVFDDLLGAGLGELGVFTPDSKAYIAWNANDIFERAS